MQVKLMVFVPFIIIAWCLPACDTETELPVVAFTVIASGNNAISDLPLNRKFEVFTDQASFNSHLYSYIQPSVEHSVDFNSRRVALLSMGPRSSGGYSISAQSIEDHAAFIKLKVLLIKPGNHCDTTQALSAPFEFIEIESVNELVIEERVETIDCD
ncbi:MAG: protease complex subunit PrcB family protein [Gammaproteobacteria bacterium]|nr:protease complex subunit PrcB family protein [Gammaproteobacteria bacterium]